MRVLWYVEITKLLLSVAADDDIDVSLAVVGKRLFFIGTINTRRRRRRLFILLNRHNHPIHPSVHSCRSVPSCAVEFGGSTKPKCATNASGRTQMRIFSLRFIKDIWVNHTNGHTYLFMYVCMYITTIST